MLGDANQTFLFLQGPVSPFFPRLADRLEMDGHRVRAVNLCLGDWLFWRRPGGIDYRGRLADWPGFVARLMADEAVTDLVLLGEQRPYHKAAIAEAHRLGVRVTVTDFGYLRPDWLAFERDGMSGLSHFPRTAGAIRTLAAGFAEPDLAARYTDDFTVQATWDVTYNLCNALLGFPYPHYRTHHVHHPVPMHLGTGWRLLRAGRNHRQAQIGFEAVRQAGQPYWLFLMQMAIDYSIRAYSPFAGMDEPLALTIAAFAREAPADGRLFVKLHPMDSGLRDWRGLVARLARTHGVADRVLFIDGGDLGQLLADARGVVTVNSTAGIAALRAGVPTLALGEAIYAVEGLTFQGTLGAFWRGAGPPDPNLVDAFVRAVCGAIQIRGTFYSGEGLNAAVVAAADRLTAANAEAMAARIARAGTAGPSASEPARRRVH